jgi:hypothetical protein
MTIANVMAALGTSKLISIIPKFSHLVKNQEFKSADALFMKNFWVSMKLSLAATASLTLIAYFTISFSILQRLLPWNELLILLLALVAFNGTNIMASYFRAYGKEPMVKINAYTTVTSLLVLGYLISEHLFLQAIFILLGSGGALLIRSILLTKSHLESKSE